jgi:hypothetical protein
LGYILGDLFHKLIRSPWSGRPIFFRPKWKRTKFDIFFWGGQQVPLDRVNIDTAVCVSSRPSSKSDGRDRRYKTLRDQGCQMVCFQTKPPVWVHLGSPLNGKIFYDHLVHFVATCFISWQLGIRCSNSLKYSYFGIVCQEKSGNPVRDGVRCFNSPRWSKHCKGCLRKIGGCHGTFDLEVIFKLAPAYQLY